MKANSNDRFTWEDEGDFAVAPTPPTAHDPTTCNMCQRLSTIIENAETPEAKLEAERMLNTHKQTVATQGTT